MSSLKGKIDTAVGKAKEKVGYVIGSDKMQTKGAAPAVRGNLLVGCFYIIQGKKRWRAKDLRRWNVGRKLPRPLGGSSRML